MTKLEKLKKYLRGLGSVAIAFSGGVDSTFLLKVTHDVLGDRQAVNLQGYKSGSMNNFTIPE